MAENSPKKAIQEQEPVFLLTELEQVRVLADPLRVRIMEVLGLHERTTKQVAEELGEKPTKLYHHVGELERVGLIRQTRTRRNRGTLERYYLAVARCFTADPRLFTNEDAPPDAETMQAIVSTVLDSTAQEMRRLIAHHPESSAEIVKEGVLSYLQVRGDKATLARFERRIKRLLADLERQSEDVDDGALRYRLTVAFYPLDSPRSGGDGTDGSDAS